jgi:hypothetical protein
MSGMSRRDLLRASAGAAAVAVPMSVLSSQRAGASQVLQGSQDAVAAATATGESASTADHELDGPVMFCVRDARAGEVSILHGDAEVIVRDRQLVDRILRAARRAV